MNIFDLANITRRKGLQTIREERIKREGSPYYTWQVPATAAGANSVIYVPSQFPESKKYHPLDWLEIVNNETTNDLTLTINGNDSFKVPAKTIRTLDNFALLHIAVTNDGAVVTTLGNIIVTLQRQPLTMDKWIRRR